MKQNSYEETNRLYLNKMKEVADTLASGVISGVNSESIPQYLYRYRSLNWKFLEEIITNNSMHFSTPSELNDPFDCLVNFEGEDSYKDMALPWIGVNGSLNHGLGHNKAC